MALLNDLKGSGEVSWTDDPMRLAGNAAIVANGLPSDAGALYGSLNKVHAVRERGVGTWRLSAELAAAIEAEITERVAEALRSQLPEDAPEDPKAWQGGGSPGLREVWDPKKMRWSEAEAAAVVHARDRMWMLSDALRALCTEPPELTMPMRARRELGRCLRNSREKFVGGLAGTEWAIRADALRDLLIDSGEPL